MICKAILDVAQIPRGHDDHITARYFLCSDTLKPYSFRWLVQHIADRPDGIVDEIRKAIKCPEKLSQLKNQHIMAMFGERHQAGPRGKYEKKIAK